MPIVNQKNQESNNQQKVGTLRLEIRYSIIVFEKTLHNGPEGMEPVQALEELKTGNNKTRSAKSCHRFTLEELFDHVFDPPIHTAHDHEARLPLTPLSAEACRIHGIDPKALMKRGYETFRIAGQINEGIQRLRFESYERRRHELIKTAMEERTRLRKMKLVDDGGRSMSMDSESKAPSQSTVINQVRVTSQLIETEEKRLLKAKERQKKELLQLLKVENAIAERQREQRIKLEQEQMLERQRRLEKRRKERDRADVIRYHRLRKKADEDKKEEDIRSAAKIRFQKEHEMRLEMQKQAEQNKNRAMLQQLERNQKLKVLREQAEKIEEKKRLDAQANEELRQRREAERSRKLEAKRLSDLNAIEMKRRLVSRRIQANLVAAKHRDEQKLLELQQKRERAKELQDLLASQLQRKHDEESKQKEILSRKREYQAKLSRSNQEAMIQKSAQKLKDEEEIIEKQHQAKLQRQLLVRQERSIHEEIKKENVDRFKRIEEYKRQTVMRKIEENEKKVEDMMRKKLEISETRRRAALQVKIQRDLLMAQIERSKRVGGRSIRKIIASLETERPVIREDQLSATKSIVTINDTDHSPRRGIQSLDGCDIRESDAKD